MKGFTGRWDKDNRTNANILIIEKSRGKISQDDIKAYLREIRCENGFWAILFKFSDDDYQGWYDEGDLKGDTVTLYEILENDTCPICAGTTPYQYCSKCGEKLEEGAS